MNKITKALAVFQNVQFLHEHVYKKARITLILMGVILAGFSAFIPSQAQEAIKIIVGDSLSHRGLIWAVRLSLFLFVCTSYVSISNLKDSLTLGVSPHNEDDNDKEIENRWELTIWSPITMSDVSSTEYVQRFCSLDDDEYLEKLLRYTRYMGRIVDKKISKADTALTSAFFSATSLIVFIILVQFIQYKGI